MHEMPLEKQVQNTVKSQTLASAPSVVLLSQIETKLDLVKECTRGRVERIQLPQLGAAEGLKFELS